MKCRFTPCTDSVAFICFMESGCACYPNDRVQFLCAHHAHESEPLGQFKSYPFRRLRSNAIYNSLRYGLLPWRLYEKECHYAEVSYFSHLLINVALTFRWLTHKETANDIKFELESNS